VPESEIPFFYFLESHLLKPLQHSTKSFEQSGEEDKGAEIVGLIRLPSGASKCVQTSVDCCQGSPSFLLKQLNMPCQHQF
jgi:hypothetical protein